MERPDDTFSPKNTRGHRLTIVTHLLQAIETMHRPEEMFQWLATVIVQHFDVSSIQFWTRETSWSDHPSAQLRALACQDRSLPAYMIGEKLTMTVEHIPREQHIFPPQLVEQVFPHFQATLLKRYGLNYCTYCSIDKKVSFAPTEYILSHESTSMGLMALLLLRHYPQQDLILTISTILEQAVGIAEKHRLLLPVVANSGGLSPSDRLAVPGRLALPDRLAPSQELLPQEQPSALLDLIPRPKQDARLLVSSNPFASSVTISDKQALRLYTAIDGRKTVEELLSTGITLKEVQTALQTLSKLDCIEMYTLKGQLVDVTHLLK